MSDASKSKRIHYGFVIVFCCCLIMGIDVGLVFSCAGIFYDPVSRALGVPVGQFGLYMSVSYVASTLMLPLAGKLIERHGSRRLLTINSMLLGLCVASMGLFTSVWEFYGAGVVMGVTLAFLLYLSFPILVNAWFRTKVGLMIGICSAASGIGGMIFNPIGGSIIAGHGWRAAYFAFGGLILLGVTPLIGLLLRNRPEEKGLPPYGQKEASADNLASVGKSDSGTDYSAAVRMPAFYAVMIFAFIMMAVSTLNLFIPKYVMISGFTEAEASLAAAAVMAGVTGGQTAARTDQRPQLPLRRAGMHTARSGRPRAAACRTRHALDHDLRLLHVRVGICRGDCPDRHADRPHIRQEALHPHICADLDRPVVRRSNRLGGMGTAGRRHLVPHRSDSGRHHPRSRMPSRCIRVFRSGKKIESVG